MAAVQQRKLVHKQFNSPMGLYSQENVKATLNRELKAFGGEGIEVDEQIKLNLANSAVLRAVEEEDQQIKCGYKRVAWPPASEERIIREFTPQPQGQSPAPGAGGYYPHAQQQSQAQPAAQQQHAVAPPQGPIYNNVQPRNPAQPDHPARLNYQTNYPQTQVPQNQTQVPTNYPQQQYQQQQPHQQQQPVQYTQAQYNRQPSREPAPVASEPSYPYSQQPSQAVDNLGGGGGGWKPIRAPLPKSHSEFNAGGNQAPVVYPQQQQQQQPYPYQQQPLQQQQQPPQQQYQQQYQAPYNNYQPQQQQQQYQQPGAGVPQQQQPQQQYQSQQYQPQSYQQPPPQQQQPQQPYYPQQNGGANYAQPQYNSYSQPQPTAYSQDQTDQHQQQQYYQQPQPLGQDSYRGASPGIITLRKEAPVSQTPAPVYTSQPAAVSYQGGSKLRGDLKWPPPEYKEAAARENEERRQLALGPVCRPRRINRDYKPFFAKHALNNAYPSYKVPPGTQHMLA